MKKFSVLFFSLAVLCLCAAKPAQIIQLQIETDPANASVFCNGQPAGRAPALITNITPGEHLISAEMLGYRTARKRIVVAPGQRSVEKLQLEQESMLAVIHTDPEGADVKIDGISRGKTPLLLTDLPPGKYRVTLQVPGFSAKEVELNAPDRTPVKLSVALNSDSARLHINSRPAGAEVILNGIARGTTPVTIDRIPAGNVTMEIKATGSLPYKQILSLSAGQTESITAVLESIPARLNIVSIPEKARIYVDNQFKGETPCTLENIAPGTYRIRAELRGHDISTRNVTLGRAEELTEEFRLQRNCGSLEIITQPAGVKVFVDGEELGTTLAAKDGTDQISEPLTVEMIGIGVRKVQLSKPGYVPKEFEITIERNQTATAPQHSLQRIFIKNYTLRTRDATYEGMLLNHTIAGGITMEIRPGIVKTFNAGEIIAHAPIRTEGDKPQ